jgi:hypothetical protein
MDTMAGLNATTLQQPEEPSISVENLVESITITESERAKKKNCRRASIMNWCTAEDQNALVGMGAQRQINYRPQT